MCPICKSENFIFVGNPLISLKAEKVIRKDYKVVKCLHCNFYFINPALELSESDWKYLYDNTYFVENSRWFLKKRKSDSKERITKAARFSSNKIENFLDIGCGEGYSLIEAGNRGWNVYGIDITDHRIEDAKANNIKFIHSDLINSNLRSDFFDIVYLDSVLEHVFNPSEYLTEIKRILKKGGILYLGVPNEDSLFNDVRKIFYNISGKNITEKIKPFQSPYHINGFNKKSLKFALVNAGFKIVELRNFANRLLFMREKAFSKEFLKLLLVFPIYLLAVPFKREAYLEAYVQKQ
jgi:SAM-dependent methyltransferase